MITPTLGDVRPRGRDRGSLGSALRLASLAYTPLSPAPTDNWCREPASSTFASKIGWLAYAISLSQACLTRMDRITNGSTAVHRRAGQRIFRTEGRYAAASLTIS